jgi:para-aminobenzoate synthetase component 1
MTIVRQIPWVEPLEAFAAHAGRPGALLLDSSLGDVSLGRWTFLALAPFSMLTSRSGCVVLDGRAQRGDAFEVLATLLARYALPRIEVAAGHEVVPPFCGGAAGYWGYDLARSLETLPTRSRDDTGFPDLVLGFYDAVAAFDQQRQRAWIVSTGLPELSEPNRHDRARVRFEELERLLRASLSACAPAQEPPAQEPPAQEPPAQEPPAQEPPAQEPAPISSNFTRAQYEAAVARAVAYVEAGDIFQVNLSQRFEVPLDGSRSPFELYRCLRKLSPRSLCLVFSCGRAGARLFVS